MEMYSRFFAMSVMPEILWLCILWEKTEYVKNGILLRKISGQVGDGADG